MEEKRAMKLPRTENCNSQKIGIIGCGHVGATIAYTMMESGLFTEMALIDSNTARARGEAMDLNHCLPFLAPMQIYHGDYTTLRDAAIIVIAAGAGQKSGESRLDLLRRNLVIFEEIIHRITEVNQECILLVVTNPVDILTYFAHKLSGFPAERVLGSGTVLDTARMKYLLGRQLSVDSRNVHSFIIGEHGDSELAVWSSANVSGVDLREYCSLDNNRDHSAALHEIFDYVRNSAYEIIRDKGATYYAIAQASKRIITSIVKNEHTILPVSTLLNGHYGIEELCMSVPTVVGAGGAERVLDIPLSPEEYKRLQRSASVLREAIRSLSVTEELLKV